LREQFKLLFKPRPVRGPKDDALQTNAKGQGNGAS